MNKICTWLFVFVLVIASWSIAITETNSIDITSMTYQEMVELESSIENVLLSTIFINDTILPMGRYVAGDDIPSGNYIITAKSQYTSPRIYVKVFNSDNVEIESYQLRPNVSCKVTLKDGMLMTIDENYKYEIHAEIRTLNVFFTSSESTNMMSNVNGIPGNIVSTSPNANNTSQPINTSKSNNVFTYQHDKWNLYKATVLSDTVIKIENWYRHNAYIETPYILDHSVMAINTIDTLSNFQWLDEDKTAFMVTMKDDNNPQTQFKDSTLVVFTKVE